MSGDSATRHEERVADGRQFDEFAVSSNQAADSGLSESRSRWLETSVGAQATLQRGFDITKAEQSEGAVPVISSGGVSSFHSSAMVKGPGVVLGRKGVVGSVYYCECDFWPHDTTLWVKDFHGNEPRFVYYFYRSIADELAMLDVGSANPTLNRNHVHPMRVSWPCKEEQRAVARILGSLDDRIELNRRMNRTLEALAQKLFKSWFVDFDPVVARSQSRKPFGLSDDLAALFPDAFEDSELGPIPEGWRIGGLGSIARSRRDGVSPSDVDPELPYFGLEHFERKHLMIADWGTASDVGSGKLRCSEGELLFGKLRPYFHKVALAPSTGVCSTDIMVMQPRALGWHAFLVSHVFSEDFIDHADACSGGTRMPRTEWRDVAGYEVALPSLELAERFGGIVGPSYRRMSGNVMQSRKLAALRDLLLPKLLSGEIRVPAAEKAIEAVL